MLRWIREVILNGILSVALLVGAALALGGVIFVVGWMDSLSGLAYLGMFAAFFVVVFVVAEMLDIT